MYGRHNKSSPGAHGLQIFCCLSLLNKDQLACSHPGHCERKRKAVLENSNKESKESFSLNKSDPWKVQPMFPYSGEAHYWRHQRRTAHLETVVIFAPWRSQPLNAGATEGENTSVLVAATHVKCWIILQLIVPQIPQPLNAERYMPVEF